MPEPVIIDAFRTLIGAPGGTLASIRPDDMVTIVLRLLTTLLHEMKLHGNVRFGLSTLCVGVG